MSDDYEDGQLFIDGIIERIARHGDLPDALVTVVHEHQLRTALHAVLDPLAVLVEAVEALGWEECIYDHNATCQTHFPQQHPCVAHRARQLLGLEP